MGKIFDKLVTQRVFFHLLRNNLLSEHQYGFTPGRSAPDAILQFKSWIATARSRNHHSVIISLDVKSAFSRVWWPLVLHNLKVKDCPKNLFKVISSFLEDRKISFSYGDSSFLHGYDIGCLQGSNSGPLLWLLVVDEALNITFDPNTKVLAYADDIYLFVEASGKHTIKTQVQEALFLLDRWSKKAKVTFAHEKMQLIPFGKKGYQKHPPYCSFNGKSIKLNRQMKILGVILDDRLNGLSHINYLRDKISKITMRLTIAKTRKGLSGRVLKALYKRALERTIVYAAPVWWTGTVNQCNKVTTIQRQILLAVTGAFRTTSTVALHTISGIEPIDLVLEMESTICRAKHGEPIPSLLRRDLQFINLETYTNHWHHPGSITPPIWSTVNTPAALSIYTDGSKR
ncbi:Putative protein in type-1 retrotransposable element R1DM [Araneus ventricosus]|uniref:Reverse transcriptase domain-containing protein n=1 Tax=Araneus ventricosus TaxID=182803 RepID=A0A4Y2WZ30_ARAVE|nr:Putative protein in type-1 retrotransposable element R1DM [Araneus ventricosus]